MCNSVYSAFTEFPLSSSASEAGRNGAKHASDVPYQPRPQYVLWSAWNDSYGLSSGGDGTSWNAVPSDGTNARSNAQTTWTGPPSPPPRFSTFSWPKKPPQRYSKQGNGGSIYSSTSKWNCSASISTTASTSDSNDATTGRPSFVNN